jgi:7,8-dihydropterin-6-yl-methyl-4-(beta-D-ribofuranosyl)aminobenzene 5'-phosphate synthase
VITGCGHAGTINTVQHARSVVREAPACGLIVGLRLFASGDQEVRWTATRLKNSAWLTCWARTARGSRRCTGCGIAGLSRKTAVVGAVGSSFSLDKGLDPLDLAR